MLRALLTMIATLASCERAHKPSEPPPREVRDASVVIERRVDASTMLDDAASDVLDTAIESAMADAIRAYDRLDFDEAKALVSKVLALRPDNVRMLRLATSMACIEGDRATAEQFYDRLPERDRTQMQKRCADYGIVLSGP